MGPSRIPQCESPGILTGTFSCSLQQPDRSRELTVVLEPCDQLKQPQLPRLIRVDENSIFPGSFELTGLNTRLD
jgi:hypothetical protein